MSAETTVNKGNEKASRPSTVRTLQLRRTYMEQTPSLCADRSVLVTDSYKETEALPPVLRQAMAFDKVLSEVPLWILEGELIVGNIASRQRGAFLFPEYDSTWIEPEFDTISKRKPIRLLKLLCTILASSPGPESEGTLCIWWGMLQAKSR